MGRGGGEIEKGPAESWWTPVQRREDGRFWEASDTASATIGVKERTGMEGSLDSNP